MFREAFTQDVGESENWPGFPENDENDVILITKSHVSSPVISQAPTLFCPAVLMEQLSLDDLKLQRLPPLGEYSIGLYHERSGWSSLT